MSDILENDHVLHTEIIIRSIRQFLEFSRARTCSLLTQEQMLRTEHVVTYTPTCCEINRYTRRNRHMELSRTATCAVCCLEVVVRLVIAVA